MGRFSVLAYGYVIYSASIPALRARSADQPTGPNGQTAMAEGFPAGSKGLGRECPNQFCPNPLCPSTTCPSGHYGHYGPKPIRGHEAFNSRIREIASSFC